MDGLNVGFLFILIHDEIAPLHYSPSFPIITTLLIMLIVLAPCDAYILYFMHIVLARSFRSLSLP